ncbi:MAG: HXXEE domain-containing protein [Chloroflexi bacterium]|nr:MAG: HXXEE domain-containing protein [Chloroflexota bacterium]
MTSQQNKTSIISWLADHWPKATLFLAVYTSILLYLFLYEQNFLLFLIWLQTPIYWIHQFEEYVYPGGFARFFNRRLLGSDQDDWPVTKMFSLWINIPIIFVAFPVSAVLAGIFGLSWGIWTAYFSVLNALSHVGMFPRFGYNPGFFVSILFNIPIGVYTIYLFLINDSITHGAHITGLVVALLVQAALMAWGLGVMRQRVRIRKAASTHN